jgi:hypothetical protein
VPTGFLEGFYTLEDLQLNNIGIEKVCSLQSEAELLGLD